MNLHPRTLPVNTAKNDIAVAFWRLVEKHELTYGETVKILGGLVARAGELLVRDERHPDAALGDDDTR